MDKFPVAILTISDRGSRGDREDISGPAIQNIITGIGGQVLRSNIISDDLEGISQQLKDWADSDEFALILTTGGTGISARDNTPEATLLAVDKVVPGLSEVMRQASKSDSPHISLSRQVVGIRGRCLIINLPGSHRGATESLETILSVIPHAIDLLYLGQTEH